MPEIFDYDLNSLKTNKLGSIRYSHNINASLINGHLLTFSQCFLWLQKACTYPNLFTYNNNPGLLVITKNFKPFK